MCVIDILRDNPHSIWLLIDINSLFYKILKNCLPKKIQHPVSPLVEN